MQETLCVSCMAVWQGMSWIGPDERVLGYRQRILRVSPRQQIRAVMSQVPLAIAVQRREEGDERDR
jgi:hypothetical protein